MLDARFVADQPDLVKDTLRRRNASPEAFEAVDIVGLASVRRAALITERDGLLNRRNVLSKDIGALMKAGKKDEAEGIKAQVNEGNARVAAIEVELEAALRELDDALMQIPNMLHAKVPTGSSEEQNEIVGGSGVPPEFDFEPKDHVAIGEALGILDLEAGAKLSGARFWVLKGAGARRHAESAASSAGILSASSTRPRRSAEASGSGAATAAWMRRAAAAGGTAGARAATKGARETEAPGASAAAMNSVEFSLAPAIRAERVQSSVAATNSAKIAARADAVVAAAAAS